MNRAVPAGARDRMSRDALNRALLERQFLLRRRKLSVGDAVQRLVGLQAQTPRSPYLSLWTRLAPFSPEGLAALLRGRRAVRLSLMRSTIHLVTARDCLALRPVLQSVMDRQLRHSSFGRNIAGVDVDALVDTGRRLLEEEPRTLADLGVALRKRWPNRDGTSLAYAIRNLVPLVQIPPRGLWDTGGAAVHTTAEGWLGRPLDSNAAPDDMVLRYLAAFGPATTRDVQNWSGLTRLQEVIDRLRPRLRTFRDDDDRELFDLPRAPRPDAGTPAPPRFLPDFDNVVLGHADRSRIFPDDGSRAAGIGRPTVLVRGYVRATWEAAVRDGSATLTVAAFERLTRQDRSAVIDEGIRLLGFLSPDARDREVRFTSNGASRNRSRA